MDKKIPVLLVAISFFVPAKQEPDFNLTCSSLWIDGTVASSTCVIPVVKLTQKPNGVCDIVSDTVVFHLVTVKGPYLTCTVSQMNTTCNGTLNDDGCACRERNEERYIVDYNITAVMTKHDGGHVICQPQCLNAMGDPTVLSPPNEPECSSIHFAATTPTATSATTAPTTTATPTDIGVQKKSSAIWIVVGVVVASWQWLVLCGLH